MNDNCPLCGGVRYARRQNLLKCTNCGLIWSNDKPCPYDKDYFNSKTETGYSNYLADEVNHRKNARSIIKKLNVSGKILDIGCAFGFFLSEARKRNCECSGVEVSEYASDYAKGLGFKSITEDIAGKDYDFVFMLGAIEHLERPDLMLDKIHSSIRYNGKLVITTLDIGKKFYHIKPPEHLWYYNRRNLTCLLNKKGFRVLSIDNYWSWYDLGDLFCRLTTFLGLKIKHKRVGISIKIPTNEMFVLAEKI